MVVRAASCLQPNSAGVSPPLLVGRDELLEDFVEALEDGPGSAGRATLYTGARGAGKTVMLNAVEDRAREHGWLIVSETATPGFVSRMTRSTSHGCCATSTPRRCSAA